jgi:hypothetical protein
VQPPRPSGERQTSRQQAKPGLKTERRHVQKFRTNLGGSHSLILLRRQTASKNCLPDQSDSAAAVKSRLRKETLNKRKPSQSDNFTLAVHFPVPFCPAASRILSITCPCPFSSRLRKISAVISIKYESRSPLQKISSAKTTPPGFFCFHLVPLLKVRRHGVVGELELVAHREIGLGNELHVAILNAVVYHLDIVSGSRRSDPVATRHLSFHFGSDCLRRVTNKKDAVMRGKPERLA